MGAFTSRQQAMQNGNSSKQPTRVSPTELQGIRENITTTKNNNSCKTTNANWEAAFTTALVPVQDYNSREETSKIPKPSSNNFGFNFSQKSKPQSAKLPKGAFYTHRPVSSSTPAKKLMYIQKPKENFHIQTSKSKVDTSAAGDHSKKSKPTFVTNAASKKQPPYGNKGYVPIASAVSGTDSEIKKKKLIVRGLKRFCESRGSSCPPTWVKDFPCKSKYHPDNYVYDWEEGPYAAKRNTDLMNKCRKKGGRCGTCGIYAVDVCRLCRKCDLDCGCPKLPQIPEFVNQLLGGDTTSWTQPLKTPRDFAGEDALRNFNPTNYYQQPPQQMPMYGYSNMPPPPPPVYPGYMYYPPPNYPPVFPGYPSAPMGYMPMPMMNLPYQNCPSPPPPYYNNNSYNVNPGNPVSNTGLFPPQEGDLQFSQPDNNVSVSMSFYDDPK